MLPCPQRDSNQLPLQSRPRALLSLDMQRRRLISIYNSFTQFSLHYSKIQDWNERPLHSRLEALPTEILLLDMHRGKSVFKTHLLISVFTVVKYRHHVLFEDNIRTFNNHIQSTIIERCANKD